MVHSSGKKRRRREKRRRELDRLRGVSLVDSASPVPPILGSPEVGDPLHQKDHERVVESTLPLHESIGSTRDIETVVASTTGVTTIPSVNAAESGKQPPPSWKRVDFVLPKEFGRKETYIFDKRQVKLKDGSPFVTNQNGHGNRQLIVTEKETRTNETIDDILFSKRKRQKTTESGTISQSEAGKNHGPEVSSNSSKLTRSVDMKRKDVLDETRRRKLEETFEAVHLDRMKSTIGANNFVELLAKTQNLRAESTSSLSKDATSDSQKSTTLNTASPGWVTSKTTQKNAVGVQPVADDTRTSISSNATVKRPAISMPGSSSNKPENLSSIGQISGRSVEEAIRDKNGLRPRANSTDGELKLPQRGLCDERMVLEAHKWIPERSRIGPHIPRGFHNLGNTCFLNATLQCLAYLPPFCQTLLAISQNQPKNGITKKLFQGQRITSSLSTLFQQAHGFRHAQSSFEGGGPISPRSIVQALPSIGSCGSRNGYKFHPGRQEDAHEFLVHLLDAMNDGELRSAGINQHVSGWRDRLPVSRLDETTFIHRIFGGYFRSQVRCRQCGYRSNTYDPFLDLALEVSKKSSNSVLNALSEFTRKETLDSANQWKCSGCKNYVCPTKQLTVFRPPLTLCIQLKRFTFVNGFGGNQSFKFSNIKSGWGGSKISKPIEFPANLDLPLSDGRSCPYSLTGVVIHVGGSASSGHYTAYVKKAVRKGAGQWYHMDDSFVEPVTEKTVLRQKDAYVLFYCRTEVKLEFPSPPPRSMSAEEAAERGRIKARARADSFSAETIEKTGKGKSPEGGMDYINSYNVVNHLDLKIPANGQKDSTIQMKPTTAATKVPTVRTTIHPLASPRNFWEEDNKTASISSTMKQSMDQSNSSSIGHNDNNKHDSSSRKVGVYDRVANTVAGKDNDRSTSSASTSSASTSSASTSSGSSSSGSTSSDGESSSNESSDGEKKKSVESNMTASKPPGASFRVIQQVKIVEAGSLKMGKSSPQVKSGRNSDASCEDNNEEEIETRKKIESHSPTYIRKEMNPLGTISEQQQEPSRTRVVLESNNSLSKVKVMLGPRKRKFWESKATTLPARGASFQLLGNMGVPRWEADDGNKEIDEESTLLATNPRRPDVHGQREMIVENLEKQNRRMKRKMHLDRWDSVLDQGRVSHTIG